MESQFTSCVAICHKCQHLWTYMGSRLAGLERALKPVSVQCSRCHDKIKLDVKNAV
ncbi:MAG: hypothetical protein WCF90_02180 [Methanomicrobiales archaeon]